MSALTRQLLLDSLGVTDSSNLQNLVTYKQFFRNADGSPITLIGASDFSLLPEVLIIDFSFVSIALGLCTIEQIIKLKNGNNSFEKWTQKMKDLGISYDFWNEYNKLKGIEQKETEPEKIDKEVAQIFINVLIDKIKNGLTKEQIINELYDVEVSIEMIEYCYNEALLKIKNNGV